MKRKYSNKKKTYRNLLILILLFVGLGYAYLQADLKINGDALFKRATWNIHWYNVSVSEGSVSGTSVTQAAHITGTNSNTVEYAVTLTNPRDYYEFTVDAKNEGTMDGMISVVSNKVYSGTTEITMPDYVGYTVTYEDGVTVAPNHLLSAGSSETYKVKVYFKDDIEASQLPSSDTSLSFEFNVTYVQADSSAIAKPGPYVYTVNKYNSSTTTPLYNAVWLNQAIHESITKYNTPSDALTAIATASSKDLPFYLKHKVENGIVTESYVEFVVTPEMAQANSGMVAGTYTLRGEKTYENGSYIVGTDYISPYYEVNKEAIKTAFGYSTNPSRCSEYGTGRSSDFYCAVSGLNADASADGYVYADDYDSSGCNVGRDGRSYCNW